MPPIGEQTCADACAGGGGEEARGDDLVGVDILVFDHNVVG